MIIVAMADHNSLLALPGQTQRRRVGRQRRTLAGIHQDLAAAAFQPGAPAVLGLQAGIARLVVDNDCDADSRRHDCGPPEDARAE